MWSWFNSIIKDISIEVMDHPFRTSAIWRGRGQIAKLKIFFFFHFSFFLPYLVEANKCFKEGITWSTKGQLDFIPQVDFQFCAKAYTQKSDTKGFTWLEDFNGYKDICIIFAELNSKQKQSKFSTEKKLCLQTAIRRMWN